MSVKKTISVVTKKKGEKSTKKKPAAEKKPDKKNKPLPKQEKPKTNTDEETEKSEGAPKIWKGPDGKSLCNIAYISKATGVGIEQLRKLQQQGVFEPIIKSKGKESVYDFAKVYSAMFAYYREKAKSRTSTESMEMADEKLRQMAAKRELEEMKVKRARGELHHTEDIIQIFGAIFNRIHTGFESFPLGLAPKLVGKTNTMEIATEIKTYLDKILYEITNYDVEALKADIGPEYLAKIEAEDKAEHRR
jgi:phage terminase Nu1 subunit (DNA packaging protein)